MSKSYTNIAEYETAKKSNGFWAKIKKLPILIKLILIIALIVLIVVIGAILIQNIITRVGGGMSPQGIREISQLATLEYRYKDVIIIDEEQVFKLFGLWDIDPGGSTLIMQYDGVIKLGIDFGKIKINERNVNDDGKTILEILLPPVEVISSETPFNTFETLVDRGIFTKQTVSHESFYKVAGERQERYKTEVLNGDIGITALDNAKKQIQAFLEDISSTQQNYEIIWY